MKKTTKSLLILSCATTLTLLGGLTIIAYGQGPRHPHPKSPMVRSGGEFTPEVKIEIRDGFRYITSNGIPDHATGNFPNPGNPNTIAPQRYHFRIPESPKFAAKPSHSKLFGVAINGVPFDPGTAELWNGDFRWHYEALSGYIPSNGGLGVDENLAHVQPNGAYHYHGMPMGLLKQLDYKNKMALVGYASDGFPVYGPYAYSDANNPKSPLKMLKSSYRVKSGTRPGGNEGPGGAYDGSFAQDYEFKEGLGDLDSSNGRQGVTPEYPQGTYYYVLTGNWPFVPREVKGTPDSSFAQGGPGGQRGGRRPGNFGNPGDQGGFGQGEPGGPPPEDGQGGPPPFGQGGPRGQGGRGPGGPPPGMVPGDLLPQYLNLTSVQKQKLERLIKTIDAFRNENFSLRAFGQLKLTEEQMRKIASGSAVNTVLTATQKKVVTANPRPRFGGPGGPGGPGGGPPPFGGPGGQGEPGGPGGPPPGE